MKWWVAFCFLYVCRILLVREAFLFLFLTNFPAVLAFHPPCHSHCICFGFLVYFDFQSTSSRPTRTAFGLPQFEFSFLCLYISVLPAILTEVTTRPSTHQR